MAAEIRVRSELTKLVEDLSKIQKAAEQLSDSMKQTVEGVGDAVEKQNKKVETGFQKMGNFGRRVFDQLKQDIKSLASINALTAGLKLNEQFKGTVSQTVALSDQIRKLGGTFGVTSNQFSAFQAKLTKGLGQVGLSSEAATNVLAGLAGTAVRGQDSVAGYAKSAGMLASIGREQGNEGGIAKGMASVLSARGMDPNDAKARADLEGELTAAMQATGKNASELVGAMERLYASMDKESRKGTSFKAMGQMAGLAAVGGPGATKALEEYLGKSEIEKMAMKAQGFGGVMGPGGVDIKALQKFITEGQKRIGFDPRKAMETFGFSPEAAEGLVRLAENGKQAADVMQQLNDASRDTEQVYKSNRTLLESFNSSLNRVKGFLGGPLSKVSQGLTDMLGGASGSDLGAAAVVGGSGLLAAVLAGGGLRGLGKGLGIGGLAKAGAVETLTGREVQPVYVTNASEIGGGAAEGLAGMAKMKGAAGLLGKAGAIGGAGAAGYALGSEVLNPLIDTYTQGKTSEGFEGSAVERLIFKLDKLMGGQSAKAIEQGIAAQQRVKVEVQLNKRDLKEANKPGRGSGN